MLLEQGLSQCVAFEWKERRNQWIAHMLLDQTKEPTSSFINSTLIVSSAHVDSITNRWELAFRDSSNALQVAPCLDADQRNRTFISSTKVLSTV